MIIFSKISENITYYHLAMLYMFPRFLGKVTVKLSKLDIPKIRWWLRLKEELLEHAKLVPKFRCQIWWGGLDKTRWECIMGDEWVEMLVENKQMMWGNEKEKWNMGFLLFICLKFALRMCQDQLSVWSWLVIDSLTLHFSHSMESIIGSGSPTK